MKKRNFKSLQISLRQRRDYSFLEMKKKSPSPQQEVPWVMITLPGQMEAVGTIIQFGQMEVEVLEARPIIRKTPKVMVGYVVFLLVVKRRHHGSIKSIIYHQSRRSHLKGNIEGKEVTLLLPQVLSSQDRSR